MYWYRLQIKWDYKKISLSVLKTLDTFFRIAVHWADTNVNGLEELIYLANEPKFKAFF
jgi:hypothetical protein